MFSRDLRATASSIVWCLKQIDQLSLEKKPDDHPDYDIEPIVVRLKRSHRFDAPEVG